MPKNGRALGGDIMKGEGNIPADGLGPGNRQRKPTGRIEGGLTLGPMATQYTGKGGDLPKGNKGGLAIGTQGWVREKIAEGDIAGGMASNNSGTSVFDPVLCELAYRWFCPPGGQVLDPFAGGSVRGIVASRLGRPYVGIDLSDAQCEANEVQAQKICREGEPIPKWIVGDSRVKLPELIDHVDFVFTCPPYADLEVYSDDERDLSTMDYPVFRSVYYDIIAACCGLLKDDRFACFIVGDVRDKSGNYRGLPWHTVEAFQRGGLALYNEAVLVTAAGSLPIRAGKQFATSRKLGKTHQNVLVFVKGDARKATAAIGEVEFFDIEDTEALPQAGAKPAAMDDAILGGEV